MKCQICGMNINEKNYDFNEFAFLKKNDINHIIYCPFCGVSSVYLSDNDEIITIDRKNINKDTLKVLDNAVKLEIFNGDFYNRAAKITSNEELSKLFEGLSKIEMFHARVHMRIGGFTKTPNLRNISYDKYDNDNALLQLAMKKEEHAISYYERYKNKIEDVNLIRVFEALIEVEKDHIELVSK